MTHIEYFKLQAKNLFKDYKTQYVYLVDPDGTEHYTYKPTYFDIDRIFLEYDWDEENFSLMKAQHLIALMLGFEKWADLLKASAAKLELARLVFDNQHKISFEEWDDYIKDLERTSNQVFDDEVRAEIFKEVFANVEGHYNPFEDYRLNRKSA